MNLGNLWRTLSNRWLYLAGTLIIASLFGAALYLQYVLHQEPCPLCMIQRVIFISMLVLFALATLHGPKRTGAKIYGALITLLALSGIGVASRHIWIQHLPKDEVPACGPGLNYMLENFPMVMRRLPFQSGGPSQAGCHSTALTISRRSVFCMT